MIERADYNIDLVKRLTEKFKNLGLIYASIVLFERDTLNIAVIQTIHTFGDHHGVDPRGYTYRIHIKDLVPYFYKLHGESVGLDKQLIEIIVGHQNASIEYYSAIRAQHDLWTTSQDNPDQKRMFDLSLQREYKPRHTALDKVYLPEWDEICVTVPKRFERVILLQLTKPFKNELWLLLVVLFVFRLWLRRFKIRMVILAFSIMDFLLIEGYLVKVIQFLTNLQYAPDPSTMAELIERGEIFAALPLEQQALNGFGKVNFFQMSQDKGHYLMKYATVHFCKTAQMFEHSSYNINPATNDKLFFTLKERLMPFPNYYEFAKNHPLRELFEQHLRSVFESGIWRKIYDFYVSKEERFRTFLAPNEYPIGFKDLGSLWIMLALGFIVSVLCFLIEYFRK